jgi:hypothetical protein
MRIVIAMMGALFLNIAAFGQSAPAPQPKPREQQQQQGQSTDYLYEVPVKRGEGFKRPQLSMQQALKLAEAYIEREGIAISPYYLLEAKLCFYTSPQDGSQSKWWWFWWVGENGVFGDYVEIRVEMNGETRRMPSM